MGISPRTLRPSSTFTPRSISGLALWLDASSSDLYTTDAGPVVPVNDPLDIATPALWLDGADSSAASMTLDGSLVETWKDKSGNGRDFTASGTARPTLTAAGQNGRSVVTLDGTDDSLTGPAGFSLTDTHTVLAVVKPDVRKIAGLLSGSVTQANLIYGDGSSSFSGTKFGAFGVGRAVYGGGTITTGSFQVFSAVLSGSTLPTNLSMFTNGMGGVATVETAGTAPGAAMTASLLIGTTQVNQFWDGDVAEIIVYPTALTTADRARVESYLAAKWAISGVHAPATASSDPVGYWGDKSGNGRHVTTSDASTRPVIHSATHNGRKVLDFDGANDTLSRENYTAESDLTGLTRFGVFYSDSGAGPFHLSSVYNGGSYSSFTSASSLLSTHAGLSNSSQHANVSSVLTTGTTPRVFCARYDGTAGSFAAGLNIIMDGVTLPVASTTGTFPSSLPGGSPSLFIGSNIRANNWLNGKLCEYISYARALTTAERQRVERYLATRWGITLAPQVANPDAQNWIDRVYANGGSVSSATAQAVNTFCEAIDAASLRSKMLRLNLFCGTGLNACLTPLYRAASLGDTQLGNATDTNTGGLFVSGDYNETGASGGLVGNGTSKYLNTGFAPSALPSVATGHMAVYAPQITPVDATRAFMGCASGGSQYNLSYSLNSGTGLARLRTTWGGTSGHDANEPSGVFRGGLRLSTRTGSTALRTYHNTTQVSLLETSVTPSSHVNNWFVFAFNSAGTPIQYSSDSMRAYSIGESMSAEQVAAYYTAMQAFQTALTRNV